jgi:23S rRNA pseudouridine1911/1915/1917 synthase
MKYIAVASISLLEALSLLAPESSKNSLRSWLKEGRILVDGTVIKTASFEVQKGQTVSIGQRKKIIFSKIAVIYEDDDFIIINKPAGLLSVSTAFQKVETAHALLKEYYRPRKVFVVHRLDQETSGIMVFAFNQMSYERLKELFRAHTIERAYTAIVENAPSPLNGTWESYQYEDERYLVHNTDDETEGRLAVTHYKTLKKNSHYAWLQLKLETGRKNQIRVHCQTAGCPVVGDKKYGSRSNIIQRLALHAHLLAFKHPISHKYFKFESDVPESFYRLIPQGPRKTVEQ